VKNVSIYKEKLAAHLNERVLIYVAATEDKTQKYKLHKRINKKIECSSFHILSHSLAVAQKRRIQLLKLNGELEREWVYLFISLIF
jgi:enoyl-[acyl-carrier-protein] reductase (NADH)